MATVINMLGGASGGLKPQIIVTAPTGSTVTCDGITGTEVSGTWTFDTTIGTHTIVATLESSSKTQTVSVTEVAQYPVSISYGTYLYNEGDECTDLTGGWMQASHSYGNPSSLWGTITRNSDNLQIYDTPSGNEAMGLVTVNQINTSNYTTLKAELSFDTSVANGIRWIGFINDNSGYGYAYNKNAALSYTNLPLTVESRATYSIALSAISDSHFIFATGCPGNSAPGSVRMYKVWLE